MVLLGLTGEGLPRSETARVVDGYASKLLRSGHVYKRVVDIITAGIRGYERRLRRCQREGRSIFRTNMESLGSRQQKKVLGRPGNNSSLSGILGVGP